MASHWTQLKRLVLRINPNAYSLYYQALCIVCSCFSSDGFYGVHTFYKEQRDKEGGIISNPLTLLALIYSPPLSPRTYPILSLCIPLYPSFTPFRPIVLIFFISFLPLFHLIHPSTPSPLIHSSPPPFFNFHSPLPLSSWIIIESKTDVLFANNFAHICKWEYNIGI